MPAFHSFGCGKNDHSAASYTQDPNGNEMRWYQAGYQGLIGASHMVRKKNESGPKTGELSPSQSIDARIEELGDWRGEMLARIRRLIKQADPDVVEVWKWRGVPVWEHAGSICTGETYKNAVKMTFAKGASLEDPSGLFNASLDGNTRRAIDFHEADKINENALKALIRAAIDLNMAKRANAPRVRSQKRSKDT
jgi:hypothetical protein